MKRTVIFIVTVLCINSIIASQFSNYDIISNNNQYVTYLSISNSINMVSNNLSAEKRKLIADVKDNDISTNSWAEIEIVSSDGTQSMGFHTVYEGIPLEIEIDNQDWEVEIINKSSSAEVTWWIEDIN